MSLDCSSLYKYDENSPSCLSDIDGNPVGYQNTLGYWLIPRVEGLTVLVHRIICSLHGHDIDGKIVDHLDRNPANNNITNLRVVSQKDNMKNKGRYITNKSGINGLYFEEKLGSSYWVVQWLNEADRKMRVRFKIKDTGDLESKRAEAVAFREEVQRALVLNQGYTITHGD